MNNILPFCVYVLFSDKDKLLYFGFTSDLSKRIKAHDQGHCLSTRHRRPLKLIFSEYYLFKEDALRRESYFKSTMGKKAIRLMLASTLNKLGYKYMKLITIISDEVK